MLKQVLFSDFYRLGARAPVIAHSGDFLMTGIYLPSHQKTFQKSQELVMIKQEKLLIV